jgi:hypothetical protein
MAETRHDVPGDRLIDNAIQRLGDAMAAQGLRLQASTDDTFTTAANLVYALNSASLATWERSAKSSVVAAIDAARAGVPAPLWALMHTHLRGLSDGALFLVPPDTQTRLQASQIRARYTMLLHINHDPDEKLDYNGTLDASTAYAVGEHFEKVHEKARKTSVTNGALDGKLDFIKYAIQDLVDHTAKDDPVALGKLVLAIKLSTFVASRTGSPLRYNALGYLRNEANDALDVVLSKLPSAAQAAYFAAATDTTNFQWLDVDLRAVTTTLDEAEWDAMLMDLAGITSSEHPITAPEPPPQVQQLQETVAQLRAQTRAFADASVLQKRIAALEGRKTELEAETAKAKTTLEATQAETNGAQKLLDVAVEQRSAAEAETADLIRETSEMEAALASAKASVAAKKRALDALEADLVAAQATVATATPATQEESTTVAELRARLSDQQASAAALGESLEAAKARLEEQTKAHGRELAAFKQDQSELETVNKALQSTETQRVAKIAELEAELNETKVALQDAADEQEQRQSFSDASVSDALIESLREVRDRTSRANELFKEIADSEARLAAVNEKRAYTQEILEGLNDDVSAARGELDELNVSLEAKRDEDEARKRRRTKAAEATQADVDKKARRVAELEAESAENTALLDSLRADLAAAQAESSKLAAELEDEKKAIVVSTAATEAKLERLEARLETEKQGLAAVQAQQAAAEAELKATTAETTAQQKASETLGAALAEKQAKVAAATQALEDARAAAEQQTTASQEKLAEAEQKIAAKRAELAEATAALDSTQAAAATAAAAAQASTEALERVRAELAELTEEVSQAQREEQATIARQNILEKSVDGLVQRRQELQAIIDALSRRYNEAINDYAAKYRDRTEEFNDFVNDLEADKQAFAETLTTWKTKRIALATAEVAAVAAARPPPAVPPDAADALDRLLAKPALAGLTYGDVVNNACLYATVAKINNSLDAAEDSGNRLAFSGGKLIATIDDQNYPVYPAPR